MFNSLKEKLTTANLEKCYVVIGPPRCGTSLLANMLVEGGIDFGNNLIKATPANPEGFYEDITIQKENNKLFRYLTEHGKSSDFGFFLARNTAERIKEVYLMSKVKSAIENLNKRTNPRWGFKDPALCITFRRLHTYFKEVKPIYIVRDPAEVVISEVTTGGSSPLKAFNLWNECVLSVLEYKLKFKGPLILYHKLVQKDKKTLERIRTYLESNKEDLAKVIKIQHYRSKGSLPHPEYTEKLWKHVVKVEENE